MSAEPDNAAACPDPRLVPTIAKSGLDESDPLKEVPEKKRKKSRSVRFPDQEQIVTQYFEPANPWHDVPTTSRAQLAAEYLECCRRHNTMPIDTVLLQIRELPENSIGGGTRAARLTLTECSLAGCHPVDALEAVLRKVQFRRLEVLHCELDDEGAEALFDMVEYYESANAVCISGPRQFGIRGWQAACRMIKKSAELSEVSISESALCAQHAPVLVRALRLHTCRLRSLCLQRAELRGEPLLCLVIALKSNTSIRELRLPDNQLSVNDAQQLASLLKLNLHIQLLDLSNNDIQDAGTGHLADALVEQAAQTPPSAGNSPISPLHCTPGGRESRLGLAFLVLWNNQLTRNCAPHLTKALSSSQSLCVLNIGRNALGADTVRALQCGGALVCLGLQAARLGPGAARPLAHLLKPDTKLQRLDLRDNRLGVAGLQAILAAMQDNTTITQIDLDDPAEPTTTLSAEDGEAATVARLTREITALCRRNEPPATEPERRVHRKISLTCHTAAVIKTPPSCAEASRCRSARLRSPAPSPAASPAGSPIPHQHHHSRFNVTRVSSERELSAESASPPHPRRPDTPTSRFKVVQVAEPPQIQIHPATQKRSSSRFSVTRNYDVTYNPSPSPTPSSASPSASPSPSPSPVPSLENVMTSSESVMTSSESVMTSSESVMTNLAGTPCVIARTVNTGTNLVTDVGVMATPDASLTASPSVKSSPLVSSMPAMMTGESVMTRSESVMASSENVKTGSPTVLTSYGTASTGSLSNISSVNRSKDSSTDSLPMVIDSSMPPGLYRLFDNPIARANSPRPESPFVMSSSVVTTASPTVKTTSTVATIDIVNKSQSTAVVTSQMPDKLTNQLTPQMMSNEPQKAIDNVNPISQALTSMPPVISTKVIGPSLSQTQPTLVQSLDISNVGCVTSGVKASVTPSLAAVPSVSEMSNMPENVSQATDMQKSKTFGDLAKMEKHILETKSRTVEEKSLDIGTRDPKLDISTTPWTNVAEENISEKTSVDTLTGVIVSGTSLDTLLGTSFDTFSQTSKTITEENNEIERRESVIKVTDLESRVSNTDTNANIDRSLEEPILGPTAIPKSALEPRIIPNSRFAISPIPGNFGILSKCDNEIEFVKPVAIGSQSNIIATDRQSIKAPINKEADIITKIAEIAEIVGPKVVEPKSSTYTKEFDDKIKTDNISIDTRTILDTTKVSKVATCEENSQLSGDTRQKMQESISHNSAEDITHIKMLMEKISKPIEEFTIKKEDKGPCLEKVKIDSTPVPIFVAVEKDIDATIRSLQRSELKHLEKPELPTIKEIIQDIEVKEEDEEKGETKHQEIKPESVPEEAKELKFDVKCERREASNKNVSCSDKISETKMSEKEENVKNKTYSDVVKSDPKYKDKSEQLTHKEEISDSVLRSETKLIKNSVQVCETDKIDVQVEVTVKKESVAKVHSDQNKDYVNIDDIIKKEPRTIKQIEAITEDLGNLIQEMRDLSSKSRKIKSDCTVDIVNIETNTVPGNFNRDIVLKKNKSESSLDSPDLEVSRLMNKKLIGSPFCDSSSSLEISGSSMESLNATENMHTTCHIIPKHVVIQESEESDVELDRRRDIALSTGSSIESASEQTPVNSGNFLNMSVSSNESVSPIIFGKKKKIHDSLSSLEASMSSLDSGKQEKVMVTSADSGIEYSLQQPSENKEDNSSNEGTLTHNSSLRESVKKSEQETLTPSPKRTSSMLDVPALKTKGLDRVRKISWVAPSSSFHIPRPETEKMEKPSHLEKLLSLFQHPTSLFSRGSQSDEERKSASNTPPRKDSSLSSSFWTWGSTIEKEKDEKEDSSEATDSTLSERVQVSFVDESFSKKLDSKTPSTDTDNTLSEFQSFPTQASAEIVTDTTDQVQKCLGLSVNDKASSNGNNQRASDTIDLSKPNDLNKNYDVTTDDDKSEKSTENPTEKHAIDKDENKEEAKLEPIRPRSFAAVLKSSGSENSLDKQPSPEFGQSVEKLPSRVIRGIKENISPENTLTSSMTNAKTLVLELTERQVKNQPIVATVWEVPTLDNIELKTEDVKAHSDLAPIATIDETCDEAADNTVNVKLEFIDDVKSDETLQIPEDIEKSKVIETTAELENVDLGKDALSYLIYENQDFETGTEQRVETKIETGSLAEELKEAEIKEMLDLSPELILDEEIDSEVFVPKEIKGLKSPVIPERAMIKKANSLEDLSQREENAKISPKTKTIAFKVPETQPRDIPRTKLRTMSGSSPKSLPESLNKPCPLTKMDTCLKKRKKVSSLGKMAKDSLLALNMSEDEIAEYRRSYATSAESLRSLESVSEDANSQSGTSVDSRCRSCLRTSQESLMSLDSITEDCKCGMECEKSGRSVR